MFFLATINSEQNEISHREMVNCSNLFHSIVYNLDMP